MSSVPLKLKDSSAPVELQQMSTTEENYLAYQVGIHCASLDSSSVSRLGVKQTGTFNLIGSFTDTSYDSAIGTHSNLLTITTVGTELYQKNGTAGLPADYRIPISMRDSNGQTIIDEMDSTKLNTLLDRINSRIYTSDYPGSYKLGTSAPSGDYSVELANVMTDTRTDGHSLTYNIYKRDTMTAPTKVLPFAIKRSNGDSGDYQGLQAMTEDQVKNSLGVKARNRISSSGGIGSYLLRRSVDGTPTDGGFSGTWSAKGTATDTRQAVSDVDYTRSRSSTYQRSRTSTYSADYTRTRSSTYLRSSTVSRSSTYTTTFTNERVDTFSPAFVGDYVGDFTRTSTRDSTRASTRTLNFQRNRSSTFTGNYSRDLSFSRSFTESFTGGTFTGNFVGTELYDSDEISGTHWRINYSPGSGYYTVYIVVNGVLKSLGVRSSLSSAQDIVSGVHSNGITYNRGAFKTSYTYTWMYGLIPTSTANFTGDYLRSSVVAYTRTSTYQRTSSGNFTGDYQSLGYYTGNFTGNFLGEYTTNFQRTTSANFSRNFVGNYTGNFTRDSLNDFSRGYVGTYSRNFLGNYTGDYTGNFTGDYTGTYLGDFIGTAYYVSSSSNYHIKSGSQFYFIGGTFTRQQNFQRNSEETYQRFRATAYQRFRATNYARGFDGTYTRNFTGNFTGNYETAFSRTRSSNFVGASEFSRTFLGNYVGNFSRNFDAQYTGNYSRNFDGNYIGNYARNFLGDYARTFAGNYVGTTIGSGNTNIETYTLYVRVA